ncbi:MAG TPA: fibronectin type III domain-containing protein [Phycisphaerales bacterium]|nr:fibronectin type III domain-containing protein [Phycisphaerales bacterium]
MSTVLPSDRRLLVQFGLDHHPVWSASSAGIGLTGAQALAFKNDSAAADAAFQAASLARQQAKAATTAYYAACGNLRTTAAACVRSIKAFADVSADPGTVYATAQIPPPDPRSHTGEPPAQPTDLRAGLETNGSITLTWKCSNPPGVSRVVYIIQRRLEGQTGFSTIDFVGEKTFNDATLPRGIDGVSYIITGKAGQQTGPASSMFTLTFGVVGGGGMMITSTSTEPGEVKLAA